MLLQDFNTAAIKTLARKPVSPLKKLKRKVGYGRDEKDTGVEAEHAMKKLCLAEPSQALSRDDSMSF